MEDEKIVQLYWARSDEAIAQTAQKYGAYCNVIAFNIVRNREDAEECVNDTYWRAWNAMPPRRPNRLSTFLGKITRNLSLDLFRKKHTEKRGFGQTTLVLSELEDCIPSSNSVEEATAERLLVESLNRFLYGLPEIKRRVFMQRYWYACTVQEIAAQTDRSESGVTSMLFRVRKELKAHLEKEGIIV